MNRPAKQNAGKWLAKMQIRRVTGRETVSRSSKVSEMKVLNMSNRERKIKIEKADLEAI